MPNPSTQSAPLRSLLFVPGDSEKKMTKAQGTQASGLILDLEDSVSADRTDTARRLVREYLLGHADRKRQQVWVRINALSTAMALPDLAAIVAGRRTASCCPRWGPLRTWWRWTTTLQR